MLCTGEETTMENKDNRFYKINWERTKTPIEVSYDEYNGLGKNYLFYEQVEKMVDFCREHTKHLPVVMKEDKDSKEKKDDSKKANTGVFQVKNNSLTISMVGNRGSGKSSLMSTTRNVIEGKEDMGVYSMDIIDPNAFGDSLSMIELVVSKIFEATNNLYKDHQNISEDGDKAYHSIIDEMKSIINVIADLKACKSKFYEGNPNIEILSGIKERVNIKTKIKMLFNCFLAYTNLMNEQLNKFHSYKKIAIFIDDIDMVKNKVVYEMLEEIRQFFSENAIIFLSFKQEELYSAILQNKVYENDLLLKNNLISMHQVHEKTAKYIEKVTPVTLHVYLPSRIELYKTDYFSIIKNLIELPNDELKNKNIKNWLREKKSEIFIKDDVQELKEIISNSANDDKELLIKNLIGELKKHRIEDFYKYLMNEEVIESGIQDTSTLEFQSEGIELSDRTIKTVLSNLLNYNELEAVQAVMDKRSIEKNEDDELDIKKWIDKKILDKTQLQISPIDSIEDVEYIYPTNLRGLLQLLEIINDMVDVKYIIENYCEDNLKEKMQKSKVSKNLLSNIELYDNYLRGYSQTLLSNEDMSFLQEWKNTQLTSKNHFVCLTLENRIADYVKNNDSNNYAKERFKNTIVYEAVQVYNVSISDVYTMLEEYKKIVAKEVKDFYFIYMIKMKYGIELLSNYLKAANISTLDEEKENDSLDSYLKLVNCKIIPEDFTYLSRITKDNLSVYIRKDINGEVETKFIDKIINIKYSDYVNLLEKIIYSSESSKGDFRKNIIMQKGASKNFEKKALFTYNNLFDYEMNVRNLTNGVSYFIDPIAFLGRKDYVEDSFKVMKYVFISLFDIDILVRLRYGRSGTNEFKRAMYKIINVLRKTIDKDKLDVFGDKNVRVFEETSNMSNFIYYKIEKEWLSKISNCVFINAGSSKANYYSEDEIEFIASDITESLEKLLECINKLLKNKENNSIKGEFIEFYSVFSSRSDKLLTSEDDRKVLDDYYTRIKENKERLTKDIRKKIYEILDRIIADNEFLVTRKEDNE